MDTESWTQWGDRGWIDIAQGESTVNDVQVGNTSGGQNGGELPKIFLFEWRLTLVCADFIGVLALRVSSGK